MNTQSESRCPYTAEELRRAIKEDGELPTGEFTIEEPGSAEPAMEAEQPCNIGPDGRRIRVDIRNFKSNGNTSESPRFNETDLPRGVCIKIEKFEHRIIAYLKSQGFSNTEIAQQTGYTKSHITQVLKLPWVKAVIIEEITRAGRDATKAMLEATGLDSVAFLIEKRDDEKAQDRDRITCAKELLDRLYGKAAQPIVHSEKVDLNELTDDALAKIAFKGSTPN